MPQIIDLCATSDIESEDVIRVDREGHSFAVYHAPGGKFYVTSGLCTHEAVHLADGLVMEHIIECPKHNGRFDYRTGEAKGAPACVNLRIFPVTLAGERVTIALS